MHKKHEKEKKENTASMQANKSACQTKKLTYW